MLPVIVGVLVALLVSGLLTATQQAILSLSESRVRTLVDEGFRGGESLARLRTESKRFLVLTRLGITLANVTAATLGAAFVYLAWGRTGLIAAVVPIALLILMLGDLLPTRFALRHNVRLSLAAAPSLLLLTRVLLPVLVLLERITRAGPEQEGNGATSREEHEIRQLTTIGHDEGVIDEHERQLIERAFRLDETQAWDIMTPRVDIFAWSASLRLAEIATQLGTVPYSRVPVYGRNIDDINGVLYVRDAYQALVSGQRDVAVRDLARQPLIVPGSISLSRLLREFQARRIHLAVVVDEYGGTDGIVTLEDLLEELVGEIVDETDVMEEAFTRVSRYEIIAAGDADLREINHALNSAFPLLEHRSLNGFLLEELGRVPEPGEVLEREGVTIEVLEATDTQLLRARLRRTPPTVETPPPAGAPLDAQQPQRPQQAAREDEGAESRASGPRSSAART